MAPAEMWQVIESVAPFLTSATRLREKAGMTVDQLSHEYLLGITFWNGLDHHVTSSIPFAATCAIRTVAAYLSIRQLRVS